MIDREIVVPLRRPTAELIADLESLQRYLGRGDSDKDLRSPGEAAFRLAEMDRHRLALVAALRVIADGINALAAEFENAFGDTQWSTEAETRRSQHDPNR